MTGKRNKTWSDDHTAEWTPTIPLLTTHVVYPVQVSIFVSKTVVIVLYLLLLQRKHLHDNPLPQGLWFQSFLSVCCTCITPFAYIVHVEVADSWENNKVWTKQGISQMFLLSLGMTMGWWCCYSFAFSWALLSWPLEQHVLPSDSAGRHQVCNATQHF